MDELLSNLIGQKDRVSGEILQPGEKIYVCEPCQLGYHKDSWEFLNKKCEQCKSSINNLYILPLGITFIDISPNTNGNSFTNADNLLSSGLEKGQNKHYSEAIKDFSEALRFNSKLANAYYYRGIAYYKLGNNQAAIKDLTQAIHINSNDYKAYKHRGTAYQKLGKTLLAIKDYNQALSINPRLAEVYNKRGTAHYELENNQVAIKNYDEALRINPNDTNFYKNRGNAYYKLGDMEAAIEDYNHALRINPNNTEAQINLNVARSQFEDKQRNKNNSSNDIPSSAKGYEKYINVLDLSTIYENVGKSVHLKENIIKVIVKKKHKLIYFKFSKNIFHSLYAYVPRKSFSMFPNASSLTGKNVIISGTISLNKRNRPVIVINQPSQIRELQ